jgi:stearoyl-CoA desaturase (delta-9 desaturase)
MVTREWAAIHRKHHAKVETADDPHSPQVVGIHRVLWLGVLLYVREKKNRETISRYGHGTPDDWVERNVYSRFVFGGIVIMAAIDLAVFGLVPGGIIWAVQMAWIPFWAAGVINGVGHYFGYRNFNPEDESRNIVPWGILIGGEELHNNHHAFPTSAKLSLKWYEFDIGWAYIRLLEKCGLAKVKRVAPRLVAAKLPASDLDALNSIIAHRFEIATRFARAMKRSCYAELRRLASGGAEKTLPARRVVRDWLLGMESRLTAVERARMEAAAKSSALLAKVAATRRELVSLWEDRDATAEQLVERLRRFCHDAEKSGVDALKNFAAELRGFASAPA